MITADTSTWVAFLDGALGDDVLLLKQALQGHQLSMLPVVLTELLSDPSLPPAVAASLTDLPLIEIESGFWQCAGALRAKVLAKRRRARFAEFPYRPTLSRRRPFPDHPRPRLPLLRRSIKH